jgi:hypothetical protein
VRNLILWWPFFNLGLITIILGAVIFTFCRFIATFFTVIFFIP